MTRPLKILAFAGSARKESLNKKLVREAALGTLRADTNVIVTVIDLANYPLPIYNADDEEARGMPDNAKKLKDLFAEYDGFIIASPDYNGSFTALLKNTLDWVSRLTPEYPKNPMRGKKAAIVSASTGALGGVNGLRHLRDLLTHMGADVIDETYSLGYAAQAFNAAGKIQDPQTLQATQDVGKALVKKLRPPKP